mmetsp:Transcript_13373/g.15001  ORF Transcript_13373/g.15001 Transcript_13373/m.15001 type:complete len:104 (-) Transcript_13373:43-354(-)|eukprot:CAMPEP_0205806742 /NCGR_PEP_ID=MMETSP0205-20121125/10375_1 /ASSEMBLY_ACC=CAM_ASM_000278 /TAXON_ID=36767 /ORGANISM="Euplotes focardii, Strain TN1" /LENGTH=103 /DNA_ID=CAMNT_0053080083 /DNA_START=165 /DNA_END=476 /DNA_ORIENTATION=-
MDHKALKETYADNEKFDPLGFFFVTYRSNTIGHCLIFPDNDDRYWIKFLCADKAYREKELEKAIIGLAIEYMNTQKPDSDILYIRPFDEFQKEVIQEIGFEEE